MLDQIADGHQDPHMEDCFNVKIMILIFLSSSNVKIYNNTLAAGPALHVKKKFQIFFLP